MSTSALENEDLENVPLVRMEDVQPSRSYEVSQRRNDEVLGTCVIEDIEYDNECIVNDDDDSNIGSMVSIQSEEVDEECETEMILPDQLDKPDVSVEIKVDTKHPSSWPTLEILPGGVIKKPDKCKDESNNEKRDTDMMYACAKCSQSFKYLFCLVKHVKWHEDEAKKQNDMTKPKKETFICTHSNKRKMIMCLKALSKKKSPKKLKL